MLNEEIGPLAVQGLPYVKGHLKDCQGMDIQRSNL